VFEPRIRVSAILRWQGRILLCRHDKGGKAVQGPFFAGN